MYKISAKCIKDTEFHAEVTNNAHLVGCDVSGDVLAPSVDIDEYEDFFKSLFSLFEPNVNGDYAIRIIQSEYQFFASGEYGSRVLDYFAHNGVVRYNSQDKVSFLPNIQEKLRLWDTIKEKVKHQTRYLVDLDEDELVDIVEADTDLPAGTQLFRARIIPEGREYLQREDMGIPPVAKTVAGRANPIGIPYLYLCKDQDTTYYEVRAALQDKITVGNFVTTRRLSIVSFDTNVSLYEEYTASGELVPAIVRKHVLEAIRADLSKPLRRYDTELDYVPTQFICEYCRVKLHADGVTFESSLHPGGQNYVLFDEDAAKCVRVKKHIVVKIDIKAK